jgi:LysW-gamma-L-lysine carboxypeptidase
VIGEPNRWDRVALGYKGTAWVELTFRRGQEHTASGGQTAPEAAVEAWQAIKNFSETYNADKARVFDQIQPSLNAIQSEQGDFEQRAVIRVGVRLPPAFGPREWLAKLAELAPEAELQVLGKPRPPTPATRTPNWYAPCWRASAARGAARLSFTRPARPI